MAKTKRELRAEIATFGLVAADDASKADLVEVLKGLKADPPAVTDDADTATVATVGPTGLCLQCKKPADHKHTGV